MRIPSPCPILLWLFQVCCKLAAKSVLHSILARITQAHPATVSTHMVCLLRALNPAICLTVAPVPAEHPRQGDVAELSGFGGGHPVGGRPVLAAAGRNCAGHRVPADQGAPETSCSRASTLDCGLVRSPWDRQPPKAGSINHSSWGRTDVHAVFCPLIPHNIVPIASSCTAKCFRFNPPASGRPPMRLAVIS